MEEAALVFGPVYSRRLGLSLGVNNIPYKHCSYTCVYCQLGRTIRLTLERQAFSDPRRVVKAVEKKVKRLGRDIDYVTFVPDGEPTLDTMLGKDIEALKRELGVRVAVITNASLLWMPVVREDLAEADVVSVKVDAGSPDAWRRVNRPHPSLDFNKVVGGILDFRDEYGGRLISETMLVEGINDKVEELERIAGLLARIAPSKAYLAVPIRPPAEQWVRPARAEALVALYKLLGERGVDAEILGKPEPPPPPPREDPVGFVASTIMVHPLKLSYVEELFRNAGIDLDKALEILTGKYGAEIVSYRGESFLVRRPGYGS